MHFLSRKEQAQAYFDVLVEHGLVEMIEEKLEKWRLEHDTDADRLLWEIEDPSSVMSAEENYAVAFVTTVDELWGIHSVLPA